MGRRPKQTVLEAEAEAAKGKRKTEALEVMRQKRSAHSGLILQHKEERQGRTILEQQGRARGEAQELEEAEREGTRDLFSGSDALGSSEFEGRDADGGLGGGEGEGAGLEGEIGGGANGQDGAITAGEDGVGGGGGGGKKRKVGGTVGDKGRKRTRVKPQTFRDADFFIHDTAPNRVRRGLKGKGRKRC